MKRMSKMNIVNRNGSYSPECTECGYRFETDYADNPYTEMVAIANGKYNFCPNCGSRYMGCQVEGVDFDRCETRIKYWASGYDPMYEY